MKVVLAARNGKQLEAERKKIDKSGERTLAVAVDITNETGREALLDAATKRFGQVDVLVNNAGTDHPESFVDADFAGIEQMIELNVAAPMRLTQMVLPEMLRRASGHVVNIASMAGLAPVPYAVSYATTKHAVIGFSESLRYELEDSGVGVSVVCPSYVSEAGLFHENSGGDTSGAQTVTPADVAAGVVKAIVANRARVMVAPPLAKFAPMLRAVSPALIYKAQKIEGSTGAMKGMADRLAAEASNGAPLAAAPARPKRAAKKPG
jgi:short-subunit dehydrogenase